MSTYQQRNALADKPSIAALAPGELIYKPGPPQFSSLAGGVLGNAGTSADGWDSLFSSVASIVEGDIAGLSVFDSLLSDLGFVTGALDAVLYSPIAHDYSAYLKAGDAQLNETDTSTNPPPPHKKPHPKIEPPPRNDPKCKNRFPYGYYTYSGANLDDPCNP